MRGRMRRWIGCWMRGRMRGSSGTRRWASTGNLRGTVQDTRRACRAERARSRVGCPQHLLVAPQVPLGDFQFVARRGRTPAAQPQPPADPHTPRPSHNRRSPLLPAPSSPQKAPRPSRPFRPSPPLRSTQQRRRPPRQSVPRPGRPPKPRPPRIRHPVRSKQRPCNGHIPIRPSVPPPRATNDPKVRV